MECRRHRTANFTIDRLEPTTAWIRRCVNFRRHTVPVGTRADARSTSNPTRQPTAEGQWKLGIRFGHEDSGSRSIQASADQSGQRQETYWACLPTKDGSKPLLNKRSFVRSKPCTPITAPNPSSLSVRLSDQMLEAERRRGADIQYL